METYVLNQILPHLTDKTTILTPNRRLAAFAGQQYDNHQLKLGKKAWQSLDILPFTSWLRRLWESMLTQALIAPKALLEPLQATALWEQIIQNSHYADGLLQVHTTATQALQEAWQICKQWCVSLDNPMFTQNQDTRAFHTWATAFTQQCDAQKFTDPDSIINAVLPVLTAGAKTGLPQHILLLGFDNLAPQQQCLLDTLADLKITHQHIRAQADNTATYKLALDDTNAEILNMARWSKKTWQQNKQTSIGCIVPNLTALRAKIDTIFTQCFSQGKDLLQTKSQSLPFNISAGRPLAEYPLIHAALSALKLDPLATPTQPFCLLLRSPFFYQAETEQWARAKLEAELLGLKRLVLPFNIILHCSAKTAPRFSKVLQQFSMLYQKTPEHQAPSQWAIYFAKALQTLGWPGERELNSTEYQIQQRWQTLLLEEFTRLEQVTPQLNYHEALAQLSRLTQACIFQPQSPVAPIQILGVLEAAGLEFDYLWIMGLDDSTWPANANPNPFIPYHLQRELCMPHANAARELAFATTLQQRFFASTKQAVICSYPLASADKALQPSPLIQSLTPITLEDLKLPTYQNWAETIFQSQTLETLCDQTGPTITPQELENLTAGSAIFKDQAACPFRAFARHRLHAHGLEQPDLSLSALERGSIMHAALEYIWQRLENQANLLGTTSHALTQLIQDAIAKAIQKSTPEPISPVKAKFLQLEKQRLLFILQQWLAFEKERPAFSVVATEKKIAVQFNQFAFNARLDRIDALADGRKIIIDYKSGNSPLSTKDWLGERPNEPQLPLYAVTQHAVTQEEAIYGLAFAHISRHKRQFNGIAADEMNLSGVITPAKLQPTTNWNDLLSQWENTLKQLADAFCQGKATVDPKEGNKTCQFCDLASVCRINT